MDRLICGDVGFGKTEIAVRAAFKAVVSGKQVAILVPTTILALQHFKTFNNRLGSFGVSVDYVNRFKTTKEKKETYANLKAGNLDILIGTHSILNKSVEFKDIGLLIIDEEQKFGVSAKERLRNIKVNVDTLTLTATPIPRTLQFSLMAARDLSVIRTPPPNRQPIHTEVRVFNDKVVKESIYYEINRGGQVFIVHNRVKSLMEMATMVKRLCPDIDIAVAHGQMESKDLERVLLEFIDKKHDVLISTNIIETGLDIPNANTIIINNAHQFGMSDLHQLRGRVGRSNKKAFCYLFCPPMSTLTQEARKRLKTLEEFSDLGSGFNIAMRDLDIRGSGNMLGGEQSGFMNEIGYETYQKILAEAIQELKEREFKDLFKEEMESKKSFVKDVHVETDFEMLIPDEYVANIQERLNLYTKLDNLKSQEELEQFGVQLTDRFGPMPTQVYELFDGLKLRWICKDLGFERIILKNGKMRCFFVENPQSLYYETEFFKKLFDFIVKDGYKLGLKFKQSPKNLIIIKEGISNLKSAKSFLDSLQEGRDA
jgi:transcription-repair coupling factor (superfamily II helicase)